MTEWHTFISKLCHCWLICWFITCWAPRHCPNRCWLILNWEQIQVKFKTKYRNFYARKWVCKRSLKMTFRKCHFVWSSTNRNWDRYLSCTENLCNLNSCWKAKQDLSFSRKYTHCVLRKRYPLFSGPWSILRMFETQDDGEAFYLTGVSVWWSN